jgi:long-chain acyl-CoA synthetase
MPTLPARVAAIARREPARSALGDGRHQLSYGELWQQASALAATLRALGVETGDRVAIIAGNRIATAVAWYGIWLAGAAVVPLNAQARARDFAPWLAHCGARVLLHEAGNADVQAALAAMATPPAVLALPADPADRAARWPDAAGGDTGATRGGDDDGADVLPDAEALAAILYTSGTTGAPKGVALSHGNLAANATAIIGYLHLTGADSIVSVLPHYYAYGASVLHTHLAVGARVVFEDNLVFPQAISAALERERATGFAGVPSTFALLLDRGQLHEHDLSGLRWLSQAGGAMAPALTRRLQAALPQADLFVMYGQTEASARLTWLPPARLDAKLGSVGIAIDGVQLQVRREDGAQAAAGEHGEVWARGPNVMCGYWNAPEATAATLVDGWLRTGDLGHLDDEGYLWLAGRRSDMIKTGAHRVHPQDVEEAIAELAGVREVAVAGIDDALLGQAVAAFIVAEPAAGLTELKVKAHCRERLATYKIPKRVDFLAELPKTASGKIRRAQLAGRADTDGS